MNQRWGHGTSRNRRRELSVWAAQLVTSLSILLLATHLGAVSDQNKDAQQLVRDVIQNQLWAQTHNHNLWSYRELRKTDGKQLLFEYCETKEGTIHRLLAVNGHPLDARQRQAEDERIKRLLGSPETVREDQKKEDADGDKERSFLKLFPEAFLYRDEGRQGDLVKLSFSSNPNFHPSNDMARVLHCLQGTMVVDIHQKRLVRIDGRLMTEVKFWGGLLGRLYPGGTFSVALENVAPGDWELKSLVVEMRGKALFFKTISVDEDESFSDYSPVPPSATLAEAAEHLRKAPSS